MKPHTSLHIPTKTLEAAVTLAAARYGVTPEAVMGARKTKAIVRARQLAMYALREVRRPNGERAYGLKVIGDAFRRDHTCVINAERLVPARLEADELAVAA